MQAVVYNRNVQLIWDPMNYHCLFFLVRNSCHRSENTSPTCALRTGISEVSQFCFLSKVLRRRLKSILTGQTNKQTNNAKPKMQLIQTPLTMMMPLMAWIHLITPIQVNRMTLLKYYYLQDNSKQLLIQKLFKY